MYSPKWAANKKAAFTDNYNPSMGIVQSRHMSIQMTPLKSAEYGQPEAVESSALTPSYIFNPAVAASLSEDPSLLHSPNRRGSTNLQSKYNTDSRATRRISTLRVEGTGAGGGLDSLASGRRGTALPTGMGLQMLNAGRSPLAASGTRRLSTTPQMHSSYPAAMSDGQYAQPAVQEVGEFEDGPPVEPVAPVRRSVYTGNKPSGPSKFSLGK